MTVRDLAGVLPYIARVSMVRGGAMLFDDRMLPMLTLQEVLGEGVPRRPLRRGVWTEKRGRRTSTVAESAEGIRQLKMAWGVPPRPVKE